MAMMSICLVFSTLLASSSATASMRGWHAATMIPTEVVTKFSPSAATVPMSGDLVGSVKKKLAVEHKKLGQVSSSLLSVQNQVDHTEQSMLGKVLDLQTARSFFTRHEQIDTANEKLKDDVSRLNSQVEGLSSSLSKTQREFLANGQKYRQSEGKLDSQIIEDKTVIESINTKLETEDDVKRELKKLEKIHTDLLKEGEEAAAAGEKSEAMLETARASSKNERGRHRSLRTQLVRMNNYSIACHGRVEKASKKLGLAMMAESKDNQAAILTLKQKARANQAGEQRLLAERALLVSEVKKTENGEVDGVKRMRDLRGDLAVLEKNIVSEVRELEAKIKEEKARLKVLQTNLLENSQAEMEEMASKESVEAHVAELIKQVREEQNPIIIATTEGQNEALQQELDKATEMWKSTKEIETAAILNVDQASSQLEADQKNLKIAEEAVATAREEGNKKVSEAVKQAAISKAKSTALLEKAQAAVAARCKTKWDAIWKDKRAKLKKCKKILEEQSDEKAKKFALTETLKAKAA